MSEKLRKNLLNELRVVVIADGNYSTALSNNKLLTAMTVNEELLQLGYTLTAKGIDKLARSLSLGSFYNIFISCLGDVKAEPMYPDFPKQVMEMDEAQFRFHQVLHYFSTYGIEFLTGEEVDKGWLPDVNKTEKAETPEALLNAKVIELVGIDDLPSYVFNKLLTKRERFTIPEGEIIKEVFTEWNISSVKALEDIDIAFKENMFDIFKMLFESGNIECLGKVCQHTGDVWKCISFLLSQDGGYKRFKTSQKRILVNLLESYPIEDFEANLILSNKKAEEIKNLLNWLSYNRMSKSPAHKEAVAKLRSNKLSSWEGMAKYLIGNEADNTLQFISKRPGMMLRMLTLLLRNGFDRDKISEALNPVADKLSTQTLVTLAKHFGEDDPTNFNDEPHDLAEADSVFKIVSKAIKANLASKETPLKGKKIYIDMDEFDLENSYIECNDKSEEGGYIRSGLAYKIPENVNRLRFFVYWNDAKRVDVDLHSSLHGINGETLNVGWNTKFRYDMVAFSGDITHSDAAEFIDLDLDKCKGNIKDASFNINAYNMSSFKDIETCFVGMMAVNNINEDIKLYDPKNCFFTHELKSKMKTINYGYVDIENRCLVFKGKEGSGYYSAANNKKSDYSLMKYIVDLIVAQGGTCTGNKEEADTVLVMGHPKDDTEVSLIDNNFFLD